MVLELVTMQFAIAMMILGLTAALYVLALGYMLVIVIKDGEA